MEKTQPYIDKKAFWDSKSLKYNKGLVIAGVISILFTALLFYHVEQSIYAGITVIITGSVIYMLYIATLNVLFFLLEFVDYRYNQKTISPKAMDTIFNLFFLVSVSIPFSYPVFILVFSLS